MKRFTLAVAVFALLGSFGARAEDPPEAKGGAVKGAVVGGVAGHMMGGHAKSGAAVGAVVGHHEKAKSQARINAGGQP